MREEVKRDQKRGGEKKGKEKKMIEITNPLCREKKFITSGIKADYYTAAVRTGGEGMGGVSLLLIEKNSPGVTARRMKTQGWLSSNTACIFSNSKNIYI